MDLLLVEIGIYRNNFSFLGDLIYSINDFILIEDSKNAVLLNFNILIYKLGNIVLKFML